MFRVHGQHSRRTLHPDELELWGTSTYFEPTDARSL